MDRISRDDLIDMAGRDALGLLTPNEQSAFEEAFGRADAELKVELRSIQDSIVQLDDVLVGVEPDPDLRQRVIDFVAQNQAHAPTSSLRRRVLSTFEQYLERDLAGSVQFADRTDRVYGDRFDPIERLTAGRVSPVWRIAALVFMVISIGFAWFGLDAYSKAMGMANSIAQNRVDEIIRFQYGSLPEEYWFNPQAEVSSFLVEQKGFEGRALLAFIRPEERGFLTAIKLPASSQPYTLVAGPPGQVDQAATIATFQSTGSTCAVAFTTVGQDLRGCQWWIMGPSQIDATKMVAFLQITP